MPGGNANPLLAGRFRRFSRMVSLLASVEYRTAHRHSKRSGRLAGMMSADGRWTGAPGAAGRRVHAGMDGEDIDQPGERKNPQHLLLRPG